MLALLARGGGRAADDTGEQDERPEDAGVFAEGVRAAARDFER